MINFFKKIYNLYADGFKNMTVGKELWRLIVIKLIIVFIMGKVFFPNVYKHSFKSEEERSENIINQLIR